MSTQFTDPAVMARARVARNRAMRQRFAYTQAVEDGSLNVDDVIVAACQPGGKALLRLPLKKILAAQPKWKPKHVRTVMASLDSVLDGTTRTTGRPSHHTIAWLVDPRAKGRRLTAWVNIVHPVGSPDRGSVPDGFPYAPAHSPTTPTTTKEA